MKTYIFLAAIILGVSYLAHSNSTVSASTDIVQTKSRINAAIDARKSAEIKSANANFIRISGSLVQ